MEFNCGGEQCPSHAAGDETGSESISDASTPLSSASAFPRISTHTRQHTAYTASGKVKGKGGYGGKGNAMGKAPRSAAGLPLMLPPPEITELILEPLLSQCVQVSYLCNEWKLPLTCQLPLEFNWGVLAKLPAATREKIVRVQPQFYEHEADVNRKDMPRLDILITLEDGSWVRYHPEAAPIPSWEALPTQAMRARYNRNWSLVENRLKAHPGPAPITMW